MPIVTWLAVHATEPVADAHERLARVTTWYDEPAPVVRRSPRGHLLLAAWPAAGPFSGVATTRDAMAVTSHLPGGARSRDVMSFARGMTEHGVLDVPIPAASATLADGRLGVAGDVVGYGRVHWWRHRGLTLASNRLAPMVLFAGHVPEADVDAWTAFASGHQFFRRATPFAGIRRFEACTTWHAEDAPHGSTPVESDAFAERLATGEPPTLAEVAADMRARVAAARAHVPGVEIVGGLSGGYDSRAAIGSVLAAGIPIATHTNHPPELERVVAAQLVQRLAPGRLSWEARDRAGVRWLPVPGESGSHTLDDLLTRAVAWHRLYDGNYVASYLPSRPPARPNAPELRLNVSGVVGEAAHSQYFHPRNVRMGDVDEQVARTLDMYLANRHSDVLAQPALAAARKDAEELVTSARERGVESFHVLNHYFVFGRLPRFAGGNLGLGALMPFGVPSFVLRGVRQSLADKLAGRQHRDLAAHFVPAWTDVPYDKDLRPHLPELAVVDPPNIRMTWESPYGDAVDEVLHQPALSDLLDRPAARARLSEYRRGERGDRAAFDLTVVSPAVWFLGFLRHREELRAAISDAADPDSQPRPE